MFRKAKLTIYAAGIAGLAAFCWKNNVSMGGYLFTDLGTLFRDQGLPRVAVASYSVALYFVPNASRVHGARAYAAMMSKDYPAALAGYNRALELEGPNAPRYHTRGNIYFKMGDYNAAINDYEAGVQLDPKYVDLHRAIASTHLHTGNMRGAAKAYKDIKQFAPLTQSEAYANYYAAHIARGEDASEAGDTEMAIKIFSKLQKTESTGYFTDHIDAALRLAECRKSGKADCGATLAADDDSSLRIAKKNGIETKSPRLARAFNLRHDAIMKAETALAIALQRIAAQDHSGALEQLDRAVEAVRTGQEAVRYLEARARFREILGDSHGAYDDHQQAGYRKAWSTTLLQEFAALENKRRLQTLQRDSDE